VHYETKRKGEERRRRRRKAEEDRHSERGVMSRGRCCWRGARGGKRKAEVSGCGGELRNAILLDSGVLLLVKGRGAMTATQKLKMWVRIAKAREQSRKGILYRGW